jgi:hypothetical protein
MGVARSPGPAMLGWIAATTLLCLAISACSTPTTKSSAAPPLKACGKTLYNGAAGAVVIDATGATAHVNFITTGAGIYLRLSNSCKHGATLTVPPSDATVAAIAHTSDGAIAVIGLHPVRNYFIITAHRVDGSPTTISVDIST